MTKRIDKFSFFVGALLVCLIIGCIAQVGTTDTEGRYRALSFTEWDRGNLDGDFVILDTATGTVNAWSNGNVIVREFYVVAQ